MQENIKKAEGMKYNAVRSVWFYNQVKTGGEWDPKYGGKPEMEHAGNFNYGAMGSAAGLSDWELKAGAGFQQVRDGTSDPEFFYPRSWSYGDDPVDQLMIQFGINYYYDNDVDDSYSSKHNWNYGEYDVKSGNFDSNFYE